MILMLCDVQVIGRLGARIPDLFFHAEYPLVMRVLLPYVLNIPILSIAAACLTVMRRRITNTE